MDSMFKHFGKEKLLQYSYLVYEYKDAIKDYLVHKVEYLSKDVESYPYIYYRDKLEEFERFINYYETIILK